MVKKTIVPGMPAGFLSAQRYDAYVSQRELYAAYDTEIDGVDADRAAFTGAPYGINFDSRLLLDFDEFGYLSSVEIVGRRSQFPVAEIFLPDVSEIASVRLSTLPTAPGTEDFDSVVSVRASRDGRLVEAVIAEPMLQEPEWLRLSESFYLALTAGRLAAALFCV